MKFSEALSSLLILTFLVLGNVQKGKEIWKKGRKNLIIYMSS